MNYRKHIRLKGYDYSTNGYYFVTICTDYRKEMFKPKISQKYNHELLEDVVVVPWTASFKKNTNIIEANILDIEKKFSAEVDFYSIMPDHIHMIIVLLARHGRAITNIKNNCSKPKEYKFILDYKCF